MKKIGIFLCVVISILSFYTVTHADSGDVYVFTFCSQDGKTVAREVYHPDGTSGYAGYTCPDGTICSTSAAGTDGKNACVSGTTNVGNPGNLPNTFAIKVNNCSGSTLSVTEEFYDGSRTDDTIDCVSLLGSGSVCNPNDAGNIYDSKSIGEACISDATLPPVQAYSTQSINDCVSKGGTFDYSSGVCTVPVPVPNAPISNVVQVDSSLIHDCTVKGGTFDTSSGQCTCQYANATNAQWCSCVKNVYGDVPAICQTSSGGTTSQTAPNNGGSSGGGNVVPNTTGDGGGSSSVNVCNAGYQLASNANLCCPSGTSYACGGVGDACVSDASQCSSSQGSSQPNADQNTPNPNSGSSNSPSSSSGTSPLGGYCTSPSDCDTTKGSLSSGEAFDCIKNTCVIRHSDGGDSQAVSNTDCDSGIDCQASFGSSSVCFGSGNDHNDAMCVPKISDGTQCTRDDECSSGKCIQSTQFPQYHVCATSGQTLNNQQVSSTANPNAGKPLTPGSIVDDPACDSANVDSCFALYYAGHACTWQADQNKCMTMFQATANTACTYDNACSSNSCTNGTCGGSGTQPGANSTTTPQSCTGLNVTACFGAKATVSASDPHYNSGYACVWSDSLGCQNSFSVASGQPCTFNNSCSSGICTNGTCQ